MEWSKGIIFIYKRHFQLAWIWHANREIKFRKFLTISYQDPFGKNITFVIDKNNGYSSMLWYMLIEAMKTSEWNSHYPFFK